MTDNEFAAETERQWMAGYRAAKNQADAEIKRLNLKIEAMRKVVDASVAWTGQNVEGDLVGMNLSDAVEEYHRNDLNPICKTCGSPENLPGCVGHPCLAISSNHGAASYTRKGSEPECTCSIDGTHFCKAKGTGYCKAENPS